MRSACEVRSACECEVRSGGVPVDVKLASCFAGVSGLPGVFERSTIDPCNVQLRSKKKARDLGRGRRDLDRSPRDLRRQILRARPIKSVEIAARTTIQYSVCPRARQSRDPNAGRTRTPHSGRTTPHSVADSALRTDFALRPPDGLRTSPSARRTYFLCSSMYFRANCSSGALRRPIIFASSVAFGTSHPSCITRFTSHTAPTRFAEPQWM